MSDNSGETVPDIRAADRECTSTELHSCLTDNSGPGCG